MRESVSRAVECRRTPRRGCASSAPEIVVGDYALVHVGFAISRIDEEEAQQVFALLAEMKQLEDVT